VEREQFTIRVPKGLLDRVREEAEAYGESMNDLVVTAVEKEVKVRQQMRLLEQIEKERRRMSQRGLQPDSVPEIRAIRIGAERVD